MAPMITRGCFDCLRLPCTDCRGAVLRSHCQSVAASPPSRIGASLAYFPRSRPNIKFDLMCGMKVHTYIANLFRVNSNMLPVNFPDAASDVPKNKTKKLALTVALLLHGFFAPCAASVLLLLLQWQEEQGGRRMSSRGRSSNKVSLKFDQFFVSMYNYGGWCGLLPTALGGGGGGGLEPGDM